jgi:hypothetical protein
MADVTGLKLLLPGGARADGTDGAASVLRGHSRLEPLPCLQCGGAHVGARFAGADAPPLAEMGIDPRLLGTLGPAARYAFAAGLLLLEELRLLGREGGWALPPALQDGSGVIFASSLAQGETRPSEGGGPLLPYLLGAGVQLAQLIQARGPNCMTSATCASSLVALKMAHNFLAAGDADRILVIAADLPLHMPWVVSEFLRIKAASAAGEDEVVPPFGAKRNGFVFGEGALAILVERRGGERPPLARIADMGIGNSAFHGTRIDPRHVATVIEKVVKRVAFAENISLAAFASGAIYIAHASGTALCESAEIDALERVFGREALRRIAITGTKRLTGHCMSVGIEDAVAVAGLAAGVFPGTPVDGLDPQFGDLLFHAGGPSERRYVMRLSLGFGSQVVFVVYSRGLLAARAASGPAI